MSDTNPAVDLPEPERPEEPSAEAKAKAADPSTAPALLPRDNSAGEMT